MSAKYRNVAATYLDVPGDKFEVVQVRRTVAVEAMQRIARRKGRVLILPTLKEAPVRCGFHGSVVVLMARTAPRPGWKRPRSRGGI